MLRFDVACMALIILATTAAQAIALNVLDHGAKPDGHTDCTAAFQKALDAAGKTGAVVEVPPGMYRLDGTLTVPEGVALEGVWRGPHTSQLSKGTTLLAFAGRDDEDAAPFISLYTGSTIKGVTIFYPEQKQTDVRPYPWTIQGRGQHYNVIDVTIANAYNGIDCGTYHNEGHHLRNVHMCALRRGVFIDQCTDIGRLENVHIHNVYWWRVSAPYAPTAAENEALQKYTPEHLEGFIIGRTDWEYISNCFVIWPKIGFHFIRTQTRAGGMANAVITQSGSDIGPLAVRVDSVQQHAGIAFENCQFMRHRDRAGEHRTGEAGQLRVLGDAGLGLTADCQRRRVGLPHCLPLLELGPGQALRAGDQRLTAYELLRLPGRHAAVDAHRLGQGREVGGAYRKSLPGCVGLQRSAAQIPFEFEGDRGRSRPRQPVVLSLGRQRPNVRRFR